MLLAWLGFAGWNHTPRNTAGDARGVLFIPSCRGRRAHRERGSRGHVAAAQALGDVRQCTVLCTLSEEAHNASDATPLSSDAYRDIAGSWRLALHGARGWSPQIRVRHLPLGLEFVGGCAFTLALSPTTRRRLEADLAAAATCDELYVRRVREQAVGRRR